MKIAEALLERHDLQRRISELEKRLGESALVQEGDRPADEPEDLLAEIRAALAALRTLLVAINRSNGRALLADGKTTLMEALAQRDILRLEIGALRKLDSESSPGGLHRSYRVTRSEVRFVPTTDRGLVRRQLDEAQRRLRVLNVQIQQANWTSELIEV